MASYEAGDSFGEFALMYACARAATVVCVRPGLLWGLDRSSYKRIVQQAHAASASELEALLRACAPLRDLDARQIMALSHSMQVVRCAKAHALLKPGAAAEALYVVQRGPLRHAAPGAAPRTLRRGDHFGEEALTAGRGGAHGGPSMGEVATGEAGEAGEAATGEAATVTALEDSVLARITCESFTHYVGALQEIREAHFNERALAACAELAALSPAERRQICKLMRRVSYPAGTTIAREGGPLAQLHVIHAGEVSEFAHGQPAATLGEGAVFGQASLFRHVSAAASFVAQRPTSCTVVSRESVQRQLGPLGAILARADRKRNRKRAAGTIGLAALERKKVLGVGTFGTVWLVATAGAEAAADAEATADAGAPKCFALKCMRKAKVYEMGQVGQQ